MKKSFVKYLIAILVFTSLVYSNSIKNGFVVNWYEDGYTMNHDFERDLSMKGLYSLFTHTEVINYHPVLSIFNALEYKSFVFYKPGAHIVNLILHLLVIILLYYLFISLKVPEVATLIGLALFSLHPVNVEAVSWVSEIKFGLIAIVFFSSLLLYIRYINQGNKKIYLILSYFVYFIGLFIHPSVIFIPLLFLLLDYYFSLPINKKSIVEKVPFILSSILFAYFILGSQVITNEFSQQYTFIDRLMIASYAILFYVYKLCLPIKLIAIYGSPTLVDNYLPLKYYLSPIILLTLMFLVYRMKTYRKQVVFGGLFYVISIIYFTQIFPVEGPIISERLVYFSSIGLFFLFCFFLSKVLQNEIVISPKIKKALYVFLGIYLLFFSTSTWSRNKVWASDLTLFSDVIKKNPNTAGAYWSRANAKSSMGDPKGAIEDYTSAINLQSNVFKIYFNRAVQKTLIEDYNGAITDYTEALKLAPGEYDIFYNRGSLKMVLDNDSGAIEDFTEALYLSPEFAEAYYFRGVAKYNLGDDNGAISDYNEAIHIKPNYAESYYNRGNAKYNLKDFKGASDDYTTAIQNKPNYAEAFFNRAIQNIIMKDTLAAINDYTNAIRSNPQYANAYGARGILNLRINKVAACQDFQKAKELGLGAANEMIMKNCQ